MNKKNIFWIIFVVLIFFVSYLALEIGLRFYVSKKHQIPFFGTDQLIYSYYPPLRKVNATPVKENDGYFDILLFGGSVLDTSRSDAPSVISPEKYLYSQLEGKLSRKVRIHNLAQSAMGSLDSRFKMEYLKQNSYNLVIWYHAINDARANYAPDNIFRSDYSHYLWYDMIHALDNQRPIIKFTVVPYYMQLAWIKLEKHFKLKQYIPEYWLTNTEWEKYGAKIKTEKSFRDNLSAFLDQVKARRMTVIIPSFAYYHSSESSGDSVWGKKENTFKTVNVHNRAIKEIAGSYPYDKIYYIDMNALMTKDAAHFYDECHFKKDGAAEFVSFLVPLIVKIDKDQTRNRATNDTGR